MKKPIERLGKIVYARWPKSSWYVQLSTHDDDNDVRSITGLYVMHVADERLHTWPWQLMVASAEWVASEFPVADKTDIDEILNIMVEARNDLNVAVEQPKVVELYADGIDMPII